MVKNDLKPVRDYYQKMLDGVQQARQEGLTLDQTLDRLSVRKSFPNFRDPPPGHWAHGMQQRNIRNLWRILAEDPNAPQPAQPVRSAARPTADAGVDRIGRMDSVDIVDAMDGAKKSDFALGASACKRELADGLPGAQRPSAGGKGPRWRFSERMR